MRIYPIHAVGVDRIREIDTEKPIKVVMIADDGFIIDGHHRYFRWRLNKFAETGKREKELVDRIFQKLGKSKAKNTEELVSFFNQLDRELAQKFGKVYDEFFNFVVNEKAELFPENSAVIHVQDVPVSVINRLYQLVEGMHRGTVCWMPTVGAWIEDGDYSPYAFYFVPEISSYKFAIRKNLAEIFRIFRTLKAINYENIEIKLNEELIPLDRERIDKILSLVEAGAKVTIVDHIGSIYTDPTTGITIRKEGNKYVVKEFADSAADERPYSDISSVREILERMERIEGIHVG